MGAFMVEHQTIDEIISVVKKEKERIDGYFNDQFSFHYPEINSYLKTEDGYKELGKALLQLNLSGMYSCYTNTIESYDDYIAKYKFNELKDIEDMQKVASFNCFLTNSAYGTNPYSHLFKEVEHLMGIVSNNIIKASKEYENIEWR